MKKIAVLLTILSLTAVTGLSAQNYNWAIGVRGGVTASGITVRHNFDLRTERAGNRQRIQLL